MKKRRKYVYAIVALTVACIVGVVIGVYSIIIDNLVENRTFKVIEELGEHDRNTITMFVEYNWKNLERQGDRLIRHSDELTDLDKINEYLSLEAFDTPFDKIFLLLEDGSYYTDITYRKKDMPDYYDYKALFDGGETRILGYDRLPLMGNDMSIIYGKKLLDRQEGVTVGDGQKVFAIIGICRRSDIQAGMVIESFIDENGHPRGYSSVVTYSGDYVVNKPDIVGSDNWLRHLDECADTEMTREQAQAKIADNESFWFYHTDNGVREINYCAPFGKDISWYFLFSVDDAALAEQTNPFVELIMGALAIILLISVVAMVIIIRIQAKTEQALAQEKAQSEFLSNMSHEIRTPLNGLVGLNYLMLTSIDNPEKKEQIKEWLVKAHGTSKYLLALINDILDFSKLRAGKVEVVLGPMLIGTVIDAIRSMQGDNISGRGIEYIVDSQIDYPCVLGDEVHLKQVLMNIVSNAAKFTPAGGTITLTVRQQKIDDTHVSTIFKCADTGCGMSEEYIPRIFDVFSQDRNSNKSSIKGTGLGMPISKMLVEGMGGAIQVESKLGEGSTFTVSVPSEISDIPDYMKFNVDSKTGDSTKDEPKSLKILLAEDNELNAEILIEILRDAGFTVDHAPDGGEAVRMFRESAVGEYGVILMDMRMPVLDGCAASEQIRALDKADAKTIPIFACTANSFKEDRIKAFNSGMNDFLTKPVDIKVLLQKMDALNKRNESGEEAL